MNFIEMKGLWYWKKQQEIQEYCEAIGKESYGKKNKARRGWGGQKM